MMLCARLVSAIGCAAALTGQCFYRPRRAHQQEGMDMVTMIDILYTSYCAIETRLFEISNDCLFQNIYIL